MALTETTSWMTFLYSAAQTGTCVSIPNARAERYREDLEKMKLNGPVKVEVRRSKKSDSSTSVLNPGQSVVPGEAYMAIF